MEYNDYKPILLRASDWIQNFLHGRGKLAADSSILDGVYSDRNVQKMDDYYEIPARKRKLFWQTPFENFQTNILRVGLLGFLERMLFQMTLLSPSKLSLFSPKSLMNSIPKRTNAWNGLYRGNGLAILQFYFAHAIPASKAQKINSKTNTIVIDPVDYFKYSFIFNILFAPVQFMKLQLYNNISNKFTWKSGWLSQSFLRAHLFYSVQNTLFVGSLAYLFSKDWSLCSLLIAPLTFGMYLSSLQTNIDFQKSFGVKSENLIKISKSNLGRGMFSLLLLVNFVAGFRYFGMASHERLKADFIRENEAKGLLNSYLFKTKQFREEEKFNRVK